MDLRQSEGRFRALVSATSDVIYLMNPDWTEMQALRGRDFLSDTGEPIKDWMEKYILPKDHKRVKDAFELAIKTKTIFELEHQVVQADGSLGWTHWRAVPILDDKGEIIEWFGAASDITNQKNIAEALRKSEQHLELLRNAVPAMIFYVDDKQRYQSYNEAFCKWFGVNSTEVVGKTVREFVGEETYENILPHLERAYRGETVKYEMMVKNPRGGGWLNIVYTPHKDAEGNVVGVIVQANEISQSKQVENVLRESEERFRSLADDSPMFIFIIEPTAEASITYWNKTWLDYTGQTAEEAAGRAWDGIIHPDDVPSVFEIYVPKLEKREAYIIPAIRVLRHDGEYRWHSFKGTPRYSADGVFSGYIGTGFDIHQQKLAEENLAYRTALLEAHNHASVDGILLVDAKGKIISYNQRFIEVWNIPQHILDAKDDEAALSVAMSQLVHPQQFIDKVKYLYEHPTETSDDELEFLNGKIVERRGYPVIGKDGTYYAWSWTFKDITERKKIEQDLIDTKEQLELTFKNIPAGVYLINHNGEMVYVNQIGASIYGDFTPQDLLDVKDLPSLLKIADELFIRYDENGNYFAAENSPAFISLTTGRPSQAVMLQINKVTKVQSWYYIQGAPLLTAEGNVSMVLVTTTDITLQKTSEKAVRESEDRFRTMAETLPQMIWVRNMDGTIEYASKSWQNYTGMTDISEAWLLMTHPDDWEAIMTVWQNAFSTGIPFQYEARLKNKEGEYRWHYAVGEPVRDEWGTVVKYIGALTDIHVQKTFAENLEKLVAERTQELKRSNEDLQQFAHVASHDLKEPVRKIQTFGSRLTEEFGEQLPEKAKIYVSKMESAAQRLSTMIDGVLVYSSLDSETAPNQIISLDEVIRQIEEDLEILISQRNAVIRHRDLPSIEGSFILIYQLFYNLVNNSLKFSKKDIPATIEIEPLIVKAKDLQKHGLSGEAEQYIGIKIADNGIGFNASEGEKIFKTFSRLHSRDQYEGTGLGLSLSKKIVERHGGAISAQGRGTDGATFTIILPQKHK